MQNEVYTWGDNSSGQLGLGIVSGRGEASGAGESGTMVPTTVRFPAAISKVACGMSHSLLLSEMGHVYSMGSNEYG